ncbi:MAG: hypothetical protein JWM97_3008 [Phycisphaerales bacterium]|jgi:hypothetical protein|nr:hypothetical protein [Phycisphaerales bacterium]
MTRTMTKMTTMTTIDEPRQIGAESNDTGRADRPPGPLLHERRRADEDRHRAVGGPTESGKGDVAASPPREQRGPPSPFLRLTLGIPP